METPRIYASSNHPNAYPDLRLPPPPQGPYKFPLLVSYAPTCDDQDTDQQKSTCYDEDTDQIFCDIHTQTHIHQKVPELVGKEIMGCYYGWLILSKCGDWPELSLWNPTTHEYLHLPPLDLEKDPEFESDSVIDFGWLSSPPSDPDSVILLLRYSRPAVVLCCLHETNRRWTEISYEEQMGIDWFRDPQFCNGKLYATTIYSNQLIRIDMSFDNKETGKVRYDNEGVVIHLAQLGILSQEPPFHNKRFLVESCGELFIIFMCGDDENLLEFRSLHMFKFDFSTMAWDGVKSIKDRVFFLNEYGKSGAHFSCPAIEPWADQGSHVHIIRKVCRLYTYHAEDKTIYMSPFPCPNILPCLHRKSAYVWVMLETRSGDDNGEATGISFLLKEDRGGELGGDNGEATIISFEKEDRGRELGGDNGEATGISFEKEDRGRELGGINGEATIISFEKEDQGRGLVITTGIDDEVIYEEGEATRGRCFDDLPNHVMELIASTVA